MKKSFLLVFLSSLIATSKAQSYYGDVNHDNKVNVGDITAIANIILENQSPEEIATPYELSKCGELFKTVIGNNTLYFDLYDNLTCSIVRPEDLIDNYTVSGELNIPEFVSYCGNKYRVTTIWSSAFANCPITSVVIPSSIETINFSAFQGTSIKSLSLPESVISTDIYAFADCRELTNVQLPNTMISIYDSMFRGCSKLTSIIIPKSVKSIGQEGLWCDNLKNLFMCSPIPPEAGNGAFPDDIYNLIIYVPKGSISNYKNANYWGYFQNYIEWDAPYLRILHEYKLYSFIQRKNLMV